MLGVKKGFEVGSEIGFFESFANVWIKLLEKSASSGSEKKNERVKKELQKLLQLAEKATNQVRAKAIR